MNNNDLLYKIALSFVPGIGPITGKRLVSALGSIENVFSASTKDLLHIQGIGEKTIKDIKNPNILKRAEQEIKFIEKYHITPISYLDQNYPKPLKLLDDSPLIIYTMGNFSFDENDKYLAIVGTRKATDYGKTQCAKIIQQLAEMNINVIIISGLAYGIDYCAHKHALEHNLKTLAVLGHGLDTLYPSVHKHLAKQIIQNGLLITEYPSYTKITPENFVRRNRIIAGLAHATIVVESAIKGGALITADYALKYKKTLFAIPGRNSDEKSQGPNFLIKNHKAIMLQSAEDITSELNWQPGPKQQTIEFVELSENEKIILQLLQKNNKLHVDKLTELSDMSINTVQATLFNLELKGIIKQLPGNFYTVK
jgi:DNA processing protein